MEHENQQPEKTRLPVATIAAVVVVIAIIVALALYLFGEEEMPEPPPAPAPTQPAPPPDPQPEPEPEPEPEPAPEPEPEPEPLPALDESDEAVLEHTRETVPNPELAELLVSDEILRKFVRAVNAADEGKVVHEYRPMVSPPPPLEVEPLGEAATEAEQEYRLSEENYDRYDRYVELLAGADPAEVARQYEYFLPLLETAFQEHGVDKGRFHEVLTDAIDEVLAAPEPRRDLVLVRPKVFYEYKDPELEELPATHKLMLRMGPEHSRRVKQSLRQLRAELQKVER